MMKDIKYILDYNSIIYKEYPAKGYVITCGKPHTEIPLCFVKPEDPPLRKLLILILEDIDFCLTQW